MPPIIVYVAVQTLHSVWFRSDRWRWSFSGMWICLLYACSQLSLITQNQQNQQPWAHPSRSTQNSYRDPRKLRSDCLISPERPNTRLQPWAPAHVRTGFQTQRWILFSRDLSLARKCMTCRMMHYLVSVLQVATTTTCSYSAHCV